MSNTQRYLLVVTASLLCAALVVPSLAVGPADEAVAAPPAEDPVAVVRDVAQTCWYQGFLADVDTGDPINGTVDVAARIYDVASGGAAMWGPEEHSGVTVTEGWFNIELGSISPLPSFDDPPYYLDLTVDGESMNARMKLASVPMAHEADGFSAPVSTTFNDINTGIWISSTNASNSNSGIYAQHNGTGTAVRGYHTGSGPAIKGDALGSGLAGEFNGDVVVAGELLTSSFQMIPGAANNYVLVSDVSGNGTWQPAAGGSDGDWTIDGDDMYTTITGNLGIGTSTPGDRVEIVGPGHEDLHFESTATWGSVEYVAKTSAGVNDYLVMSKYGPMASGTIDGIPLAGVARVGSGTEAEGLMLQSLSPDDPIYFFTAGDEQMRLTASGYLGLGESVPTSYLECVAAAEPASGRMFRLRSSAVLTSSSDMLEIYAETGSAADCQLIEAQNGADIKFRVNGNGEVTADGSFTGGGADFAEMIHASSGGSSIEAGDVLVIDAASPRSVVKCRDANSSLVAGVYSTKPGFVGSTREWDVAVTDDEAPTLTRADMAAQFDEVPLAVVGIVPCKVTAENGSIAIGDLLVTSSTPGHAMRSESPRAGTILGKALEALPSGAGVIHVLVTLQ